jgi:antitoxin VapB
MTEFDRRHRQIQSFLAERDLDALLLQRVSSFAWATCGAASYVNTATTFGEATLIITPAGRFVITNNIEATRLEGEEGLAEQGWEFRGNAARRGRRTGRARLGVSSRALARRAGHDNRADSRFEDRRRRTLPGDDRHFR